MAGQHSRFGPSAAARNSDCPASLLANEQEPDIEIFEAAEGTVAHYVAEICARVEREPEEFLGNTFFSESLPDDYEDEQVSSAGFEITVDEEMVAGVTEYLDRCAGLPGDHFIEERVDISPWTPIPNQFGTCDHAAAQPRKLIVTDFKYGRVIVHAERNRQLAMYALGFINEWDWLYGFEEVIIRIVQPRLDHFDVWSTTKAELLAMGEWLKSRFAMALQPNPPFGPSETACRFCKVKYKCRANHDFLYRERVMLVDNEDEFVEEDVSFMSDEEVSRVWLRKPMYESRMKAIEDRLHRLVADTGFAPGVKTVAGRKSRYVKDDVGYELFLLEEGVDPRLIFSKPKLISPAGAEKLLKGPARKKLHESGLIGSKPGKPCLVAADDKRRDLAVAQIDLLEDESAE